MSQRKSWGPAIIPVSGACLRQKIPVEQHPGPVIRSDFCLPFHHEQYQGNCEIPKKNINPAIWLKFIMLKNLQTFILGEWFLESLFNIQYEFCWSLKTSSAHIFSPRVERNLKSTFKKRTVDFRNLISKDLLKVKSHRGCRIYLYVCLCTIYLSYIGTNLIIT